MALTVVIPVYNEPNILEFRQRLVGALVRVTNDWTIIWCVGDSLAYEQLAPGCARQSETIIYEPNRGLGKALKTGFKLVNPSSEWVLTMDSDLQQLPEEIPLLFDRVALYKECNLDCDLLIGAKSRDDARSWGKKLISYLAYRAYRLKTGMKVKDMGSNFRLWRYWVVREIVSHDLPDGYNFQQSSLLMAWRMGARIREMPTSFRPRTAGKSKMSWRREIKERLFG